MSKKPLITVVVNTLNEAKDLDGCLNSVATLADEIIVVDMHSQDDTVAVAKKYHAKVFLHKKLDFVEPARNFALSKTSGKWILILDPDERIPARLAKKLKKIALAKEKYDCILIPRKNLIMGKWMKNSRWWPDYLPRFFKKGKIKWPKQIHQQPDLSGKSIHTLIDDESVAIIHHNYQTLSQFIQRGDRYSTIQAKELIEEKGYHLVSKDLVLKPMEEFISRFFVGEAYKDGLHGLVLSLLQSWIVLWTYLKVWEFRGYQKKSLERSKINETFRQVIYQLVFWWDEFVKKEFNKTKNLISSFLSRVRIFIMKL